MTHTKTKKQKMLENPQLARNKQARNHRRNIQQKIEGRTPRFTRAQRRTFVQRYRAKVVMHDTNT